MFGSRTVCWRRICGTIRGRGWSRRCLLSGAQPQHIIAREVLTPRLDQFLVGVTYGADVAVEIAESEGVHTAVILAETGIPIHLVLQTVPGKTKERNSVSLQAPDISKLFLQPLDSIRLGTIRFRVHHGKFVAGEVLMGDGEITENLSGWRDAAIRMHQVLVGLVVR